MLNIEQLSFWERKEYFEQIDFLIVGAGIVGCSTAFHLRKRFADAKIVVLERGFLPSGASTKNAGFASFGGPVELTEDLDKNSEDLVWSTVQARYEGLVYLREIIGDNAMDFQLNGGWDLMDERDRDKFKLVSGNLSYLNANLKQITQVNDVYKVDKNAIANFGFGQFNRAFSIAIEGQIDTGKMMRRYHQLLAENNIILLHGIKVDEILQTSVITSIGEIEASKIFITVNGFAKELLPDEDVLPARAQVLVTSPIENLPFKGTFHYDSGYYYFRNFGNRVLLGGARNVDIAGETTVEMITTENIQSRLKQLLSEAILPNKDFTIDYQWSGIMGMGQSKFPIIREVRPNVFLGARLGGIGVALGTNVGKQLVDLI